MDKKYYDNLTVSAAPHIVTAMDTTKTMMLVLLALVPAFFVNIYVFGFRVVILTLVCIAASMFFEWAYNKLMHKQQTVGDLSASVTGALIAFNVPSSFPYWMAVIGCFVAIIIVKQLYGGLGRNIANPAITARIVLFVSFATEMTSWPLPRGAVAAGDAITGPTPLGLLKEGTGQPLPTNTEMFLGLTGGSMGEISAIALIIGGVFLIWKKVISPIIPVCFIGTVFVIALIYYSVVGAPEGETALQMAIFHICAGGVMIGAFFMATDYVTSPIMPLGKVIMGIGCGFFTMVIRLWASYPEGVSFSILLMNLITPLIDMLCIRLTYGGAKKNEK